MKKLLLISLGILAISSIVGIIYVYGLLTEAIHSADKYHPPAVTPIVPKASADK